MVKVDLNWMSVVGLALLLGAVALFVVELTVGRDLTVATLLGPNAPIAGYHLWMVVWVAGAAFYFTGRLILLKRKRFGLPRRPGDSDSASGGDHE